ncbi:hypothetical protein Y717_33310 [Streptomyces scopuliridis RB72]|uniref:Uncharacterized protein n=1 Tax=Streptomyces scopuliridis RB72 TaxID=1440053 RepID=A0A2T7T3T8_9ACTN|nr:hypothetical protein Y717_33310 [Streptomyces scopuliridis RB72]
MARIAAMRGVRGVLRGVDLMRLVLKEHLRCGWCLRMVPRGD